MQQVNVIRIDTNNYNRFCNLIEWRRTGKATEATSFQTDEMYEFFKTNGTFDSDTFFVFAVEEDQVLKGYINAVVIPKPDPRKGILYVDELWVPDIYRNKGYANLLMDHVINLARELDLWRVRLYVAIENQVARAFYKKTGYSEVGACQCCEIEINKVFID